MVKHILFGNDEEELATVATMFLAARGVVVAMAGEWETRPEFCKRIGISPRQFYRCLHSKWRPDVLYESGPNGRFLRIRSNLEFDAYARAHSRGRGQESVS